MQTTVDKTPESGIPGACQDLELARSNKPRSPNQFKPHFLATRASVQLATVLDPDVPDGTALALGANLALFLRENGVKPGQIIFQPGEEEEAI